MHSRTSSAASSAPLDHSAEDYNDWNQEGCTDGYQFDAGSVCPQGGFFQAMLEPDSRLLRKDKGFGDVAKAIALYSRKTVHAYLSLEAARRLMVS